MSEKDVRAHDVWASGDGYEQYVGRWSRPVAKNLFAGWRFRRIVNGWMWAVGLAR